MKISTRATSSLILLLFCNYCCSSFLRSDRESGQAQHRVRAAALAFLFHPTFVARHRRHPIAAAVNSRRRSFSPLQKLHFSQSADSSSSLPAKSAVSAAEAKNPWAEHDKDLLHRRYRKDRVPDDVDYVVVGSGIGGLWLGACLSKFGYRCLVLEQHYIAGGLQHTFRRKSYEFVPGLHYMANLELIDPLYRMVATPTDPPLKFKQAGFCVKDDFGVSHELVIGTFPAVNIHPSVEETRKEFLNVFPDEEKAIDDYLKLVEQAKWQAGMFVTFKIFPPWLQWLLSQTACSTYIRLARQTTEEILEPLSSNGLLKTCLSAFSGDLGESLGEGSFVMQALVLGHIMEGCHYPEGGPLQLVRGLIPTIRKAGGDCLVKAPVKEILCEPNKSSFMWGAESLRATGVKLVNGDIIRARRGVISNAGLNNTLENLIPASVRNGQLKRLSKAVQECSGGGIGHCFLFIGFNSSAEQLGLRSSSFYYIPGSPWNETSIKDMDPTAIQDYYRDTLLDPSVRDVSYGMVFVTAKDPEYSAITMPNRTTAVVFSEGKLSDFESLVEIDRSEGIPKHSRTSEYEAAKNLVRDKMLRSVLDSFPHLEAYIDHVEVGTPLTMEDYTLRLETLGLRHTPRRLLDMTIRPNCAVDGLFFTGQDVAFAGWAGALTGAMVTAQRLLGYTLFDFMRGKSLMKDLGCGDLADETRQKIEESTTASPLDVMTEILQNAAIHIQKRVA